MSHRNLIVILGPTASGKSALGVKLAKNFHGVVLSADSRQVYRGMDKGTAKITTQEMQGVPHFLLDIASPRHAFTVAQYQRQALQTLKKIPENIPVFVVGGSPFYIDAILNPLPFPHVKPNLKLRHQLEHKTTAQLFVALKRKDPRRAQSIDPNNRRRLIRSLEIVHSLGLVPRRRVSSPYRVLKLGISLPRPVLYRCINLRVDRRVPGIITEVQKLKRSRVSWKRLESLGLEYRWISRIVKREISLPEGIARLKTDIHAFARRQLTWWRNDSTIRWMTNAHEAESLVRRFLK